MGMNKVKFNSNMYQFLNDYPTPGSNNGFTWNAVKGKCPHACIYCYCKRWGEQSELHLDEKEFRTDLGSGNFIFVGSSCDMWADSIPDRWINKILDYCFEYPDNRYLFQTKDPWGFLSWQFPPDTILGITLESNRHYADISKAPSPENRYLAFRDIMLPKMVSIEPTMDFDLTIMLDWIKQIATEFVSIGADSKGFHLSEPSGDKIEALIVNLREITQVKLKSNLKRLKHSEEGDEMKKYIWQSKIVVQATNLEEAKRFIESRLQSILRHPDRIPLNEIKETK